MFPLKDKRIRIGGWWSTDVNFINEEFMTMVKESGANFLMTCRLFDSESINKVLDCCDKLGMECVVFDQRVYDNVDADIASIVKEYSHHESFVGNMIMDEPGIAEFPRIRQLRDKFRESVPGKDGYINLLPMYANNKQLMYGAPASRIDYYETPNTSYHEHLDEYCKAIDTPYICVDVYPCRGSEDGKSRTIYPGYMENLSLIAHYCRKYNRELWIMVQTLIWYEGVPAPTETDLRWQFYTVLSFGATAVFHYCLTTPPGHSSGLLTAEGTKSDLFYPAKRIHSFLGAIEDVYRQYKNIGAFNVNCTEGYEFLKFEEQCKDFAPVKEVVSDDQLLVGCFEKEEGEGYAFTVVNMTHIADNKTAHVKLKLDAKKVTVYADNMSYVIAPVDGYYEFTLPCGEGIFATIE